MASDIAAAHAEVRQVDAIGKGQRMAQFRRGSAGLDRLVLVGRKGSVAAPAGRDACARCLAKAARGRAGRRALRAVGKRLQAFANPTDSTAAHGDRCCARQPPGRVALGNTTDRRSIVLYTIALVLVILWVLGLATSFTAGGLLHLLIVVAVVMVLFQLISGRRVG